MTFEEILKDILASIEDNTQHLAAPPELITTIEKLIEDEMCSLDEVVEAINSNPVIVARLLQVSNSPSIMRGRHVVNTREAINRLGLVLVKDLVFCIVLRDMMSTKDPHLKFALSTLWEHSIDISAHCAALSHLVQLEPPTALISGLLHDIGEIPVIMYYNANADKQLPPLADALVALGPKVGYALMSKWRFDYRIAQAVFHKGDTSMELHEYAGLVSLAHDFLEQGMPTLIKYFEQFSIPESKIIEALTKTGKTKSWLQ